MTDQVAIGKIPTYILSLVVLLVLIGTFAFLFTPLPNMLYNAFHNAMNIGTKPTPFTGQNEDTTTATASVHALLWSINKVAWHDTTTQLGKTPDEKISDMSKTFFGTEAIPIYNQRETILVGGYSETNVLDELARRTYDCYQIFQDRGNENTGCFTFDFSGYEDSITKNKLTSHFERYMNDETKCDTDCKSFFNNLLGIGAFDRENLKFNLERDKEISEGDQVKLCGEEKFLSFNLYITDSDVDALDICKLPAAETEYGMKVVNFHLPQELQVVQSDGSRIGDAIAWAEKYVRTYGDPEFIVYYEIFPEGEDSYWHYNAYGIPWAEILTVEGIFLAIDLIPVVGTAISNTLEKTGAKPIIAETLQRIGQKVIGKSGIRAITEAVQAATQGFTALKNFLKNLPATAFSALFKGVDDVIFIRILRREAGGEALSESAERIMLRFARALPKGIDEDTILRRMKNTFHYTHEAFEASGREAFETSGRFTREFRDELESRFTQIIKEEASGISDELTENIVKGTLDEMSDDVLRASVSPIRRLLSKASKSNNKILRVVRDFGSTSAEREKAVREIFENGRFVEDISPAELRRLSADLDKTVEYALEMQELNDDYLKEILGDTFTGDVASLSRAERSELLDNRFADLLKDTDPKAFAAGRTQAFLLPWQRPRHVITAAVVLTDSLDYSKGEKFVAVGTNAIGFRTPFLATTIHDDTYTQEVDFDKATTNDFFEYYLGYVEGESEIDESYLRYRGLLPEVERYYLSLVKDKGLEAFEQKNQRFHLASPCKADIVITKTTCECHFHPRDDTIDKTAWPDFIAPIFEKPGVYETGHYDEFYGEVIENFDRLEDNGRVISEGNSMLYTVDSNGVLVKECHPKGVFQRDNLYKPTCIEINPIIDEDLDPNYCYKGQLPGEIVAADIALNWGLPIGLTVLFSETTVGAPIAGALGGVVGQAVYVKWATGHQWPRHN